MKLGVEITPELSIEVDLPPGTPVPSAMALDWTARTEDGLRDLIVRLGFDPKEIRVDERLSVRYGVPVTRDGEQVARCSVNLWIGDDLRPPVPDPPIPVVQKVRDELLAAREVVERG